MSQAAFRPTVSSVIWVMERKGYRIHRRESGFDVNLVGIRTLSMQADIFDDFLTVFYRRNEQWVFHAFTGTTDPGAYLLGRPRNPAGDAVLREGQYLDSHVLGSHRGRYTALIQKSPLPVIRNPQREDGLDLSAGEGTLQTSGINIQRASRLRRVIRVEHWSPGCQVVCSAREYRRLMRLCRKACKAYGNSFTYTLMSELDFRNG